MFEKACLKAKKPPQNATQKMPKAFFVSDLGNRQQATGNYTHLQNNHVNYTLVFSQFFFSSLEKRPLRAFYTPRKAPRSGVDKQSQHGVAHRKSRQDEQKREGVYTKYTKPEQRAKLKGVLT